jgi:predicted DNA repair protein MutK
VTGVRADRELPVVWAVAKGSLRNKAILVPAALAISAFIPWAVTPLLMVGGLFLCYEGFEKIAHRLLHRGGEEDAHQATLARAVADPGVDLVAFERDKIRGAVRTDFILSAEIIAITLGTVAAAPFPTQVGVLVGIALIMTVGVYGLVAGIVKLDDAGLYLSRREGDDGLARLWRALGRQILTLAPYLMKGLSIAGTAAMFLVGGGIIVHGIPALHHGIEALAAGAAGLPGVGGLIGGLGAMLLNAGVGIVAGGLAVAVVSLLARFRSAKPPPAAGPA